MTKNVISETIDTASKNYTMPESIKESILLGVKTMSKLMNVSCLVVDFATGEVPFRSDTLLYLDEANAELCPRKCVNPYWSYVSDEMAELLLQLKRKGLECAKNFSPKDYMTHVCTTDFPITVNGKEIFVHQKFRPILVAPDGTISLGLFTISTSVSKEIQSYIETSSGEIWKYNFKSKQYEECKERFHLTRKEKSVLKCLVRRMNTEQIAEELGMSVNTAKKHKHNIYDKLGAHSKDDVIVIANNYHLI